MVGEHIFARQSKDYDKFYSEKRVLHALCNTA
jgi:hypothetical protein